MTMTMMTKTMMTMTIVTMTMMKMMVTNDNDGAGESLAANHPGRAKAHISVPLQVISKVCSYDIIFHEFFPPQMGRPGRRGLL